MKKSHKQISLNELYLVALEQYDTCVSLSSVARDKKDIERVMTGFMQVVLIYQIIIRKDDNFVQELIEVMTEQGEYYSKLDLLDESDSILKEALSIFFEKYPASYDEQGKDLSEYLRNQILFKLDINRRKRADKKAIVVQKREEKKQVHELMLDNNRKNF